MASTAAGSTAGLGDETLHGASLARSTRAGPGRPTSSSAPTPWCSCARAERSIAGSTVSTSEPASASASFR